ncbi:MAG: glycosyltransferase family 4 protein [Bacteroidetes bacterium]|nr:glycosyltransferase family 4 protein [Bacteroidota bacterium]
MRILMVTDDLLLGGAARHVVDLCNELCVRGHAVTLAATDGPMREFLSAQVRFIPLNLKNNRTMKNSAAGSLPSLFTLTREIRLGRYALVHSHKRYAHAVCAAATVSVPIPHITTFHSEPIGGRFRTFTGDHCIGCSTGITETLQSQFPHMRDRCITIPNGVHPLREYTEDELSNVRKELGIPPEHLIVGTVGQFVPAKDRDTLLHAIRLLRSMNDLPAFTVLLQGYGPLEQHLRSLSRALGVEGTVHFLPGSFPVAATCNLSDIMVLNSVTEGAPLILLEAASVGTAHIATRVGGIPDFIEDRVNGLLIQPSDPKALADAIRTILQDPGTASVLGNAARSRYEASFTFGTMVDRIEQLYTTIVRPA